MADLPDLSGRAATCSHCGSREPSDWTLPFFEHRGEGSYAASICVCGYAPMAHERKRAGEEVTPRVCDRYRPRGALETDRFYCGCQGYD